MQDFMRNDRSPLSLLYLIALAAALVIWVLNMHSKSKWALVLLITVLGIGVVKNIHLLARKQTR
jgi:hypothetical protein